MNKPLTPRQLKAQQKEEWKEAVKEWSEKGEIAPKTYINKREAFDAWLQTLETGDRAIPVLQYVAALHDKDEGWVDLVKNSSLHKDIINSAFRAFSEHPVSILMKDIKLSTPAHKRAIREGRSLSSVLNALSDHVQLAKRVELLEEDVQNLKMAVMFLSSQQNHIKDEKDHMQDLISNLEMDVDSMNKDKLKEKARQMYKDGYNHKQIGEKIGKHQSTIYRWLRED